MCGIAGCSGSQRPLVEQLLYRIAHRGPDDRGITEEAGFTLGHVRLSIIDPTSASHQPFRRGDVVVTFNGELWNYRELRAEMEALGDTFTTAGDTEVLAALLDRWGPDGLSRVEGMFAIAWGQDGHVWLARDRYGEVPLHYARTPHGLTWASELKALVGYGTTYDVQPGQLIKLTAHDGWAEMEPSTWYTVPEETIDPDPAVAAATVRQLLSDGTRLRGLAADVPACTLLSGGIDSAAVAAELREVIPDLVAYTAVMDPRSRDLRCARLTADALGLQLVEVKVEPPTADDLARVVMEIEQPHKAQVEIGWACLALGDAMRSDGFKVTYSGEGSDELWASYGMSYHGIKAKGWHGFRRQLVEDQARKNFARCNKVFMARSVEVRLPFLHRPLVEYALSLSQAAVTEPSRPKAVLQHAYDAALPTSVVWRPKVAFQDGMKLKDACAAAVADPARFYRAEYVAHYGNQRPRGALA